jgi:NADPH2:quinone reductase
MKAAVIGETGLSIREVPVPSPSQGQILVKVRFSGLNRADLAMSAGHKHGAAGGAGAIAGLEWSGEVVEVGVGVTDYRPGDRVMCSGAGGYAEYALSDGARCNLIPETEGGDNGYSFEEAATLPVALQTMHDALVTNGQFRKGQSVLIQGASSGVGILGMQIAMYLGAELVIGSSTDQTRRDKLVSFGADLAVDSKDPQWPEQVLAATDGRGVDLIIDQVSGETVNDSMNATAIGGRIVNVGRLGGMHADFNFDLHALRRISYVGVTFRTRSRDEVMAINEAMRRDLSVALTQRAFDIPIDRVFALEAVVEAQEYMRTNQHFGKILLAP